MKLEKNMLNRIYCTITLIKILNKSHLKKKYLNVLIGDFLCRPNYNFSFIGGGGSSTLVIYCFCNRQFTKFCRSTEKMEPCNCYN